MSSIKHCRLGIKYITHCNQLVKDLLKVLKFAIDKWVYSHRALVAVSYYFSMVIKDTTHWFFPKILPQRLDRIVVRERLVELIAKNVRHIEMTV